MARRHDVIDNQSRARDVRNFAIVVQIPIPVDGTTIIVEPEADYPFDVLDIRAFVVDGTVEITPTIDGQVIDTDGSDSSGVLLIDEPAMTTYTPDGSIFEVGREQELAFSIDNVTSDVATLVVRFACRRTEQNIIVEQLAAVIDTFVDQAQATVAKGDPRTGGPALMIAIHRTALNNVYMHLEFDVSAWSTVHGAELHFHYNAASAQPHVWEIRRMTVQVIELASSWNERDLVNSIAWGGGTDGGLDDTDAVTPTPVTGTAAALITVDADFKFAADITAFVQDAIDNRSGKLQLFIRQTVNTPTLLAAHSSRTSSRLEPKLWLTYVTGDKT